MIGVNQIFFLLNMEYSGCVVTDKKLSNVKSINMHVQTEVVLITGQI